MYVFIYTHNQQVSVQEFTAHAQSTVIECTQYFNDLIGQQIAEYSKVLLTENCTDTDIIKRLQNAKLLVSMATQKFEVTSSDLHMYGIESDPESIRATKKAIITDTLRSLKHITDAYNTFQSTVSGILIGSATDFEKVHTMRHLLIKTMGTGSSSVEINGDFQRLKRFDGV